MELTSTRSTRTLPLLTRRTPKKRSSNSDVPSSFGTEAVSLIELYASEQKPVYEPGDVNISRREFYYLPMESRGTSWSDQTRVANAMGEAPGNALPSAELRADRGRDDTRHA